MIAYVLAGGRSTRMGQDKAMLRVRGKTMLEHAISLAENCGAIETYILGRPDHPMGIADAKNFQGPAVSLADQLKQFTMSTPVLVLSVDMPNLSHTLVSQLFDNEPGAYFEDMYLPFFAVVEPGLKFEGSRMKELIQALGLKGLPTRPEWRSALLNINSPDEFVALEKDPTNLKKGMS